MTGLDRTVSRLVLGVVAPVTLVLAGWWGALGVLGDGPWVMWAAAGGLVLGGALDVTLLRRWLDTLYDLPAPVLLLVAVFYSVMVYGMFMGFPVVNLLVGITGGFVVGRRAATLGETVRVASLERRRVCLVASALMAVLCCVTAWLALSDPYTASDVRGMLGLGFTPSADQLRLLAATGGAALVVVEYAATAAAARWAARLGSVA